MDMEKCTKMSELFSVMKQGIDLRVNIDEEVLFHGHQFEAGYHCFLCGLSEKKKRLYDHMFSKHKQLTKEQKQVVRHVCEGLMQRLASASFDCSTVPPAETQRESDIVQHFVDALRTMGVPLHNEKLLRRVEKTSEQQTKKRINQEEKVMNDVILTTTEAIARQELILEEEDQHFNGGERVHQVFRQRADDKLLFDYVNDVSDTDYFTQNYVPSAERNVNEPVLDAKLKFWRRLVVDQHPLLRGYQRHLQSLKEDNMLRPSTEHGSFQHPYLANVTRFMLCAMRSRERFGQILSMDDVLYSTTSFSSYLDQIKHTGASESVQVSFVKSLISFIHYLRGVATPECFIGQRRSAFEKFERILLDHFSRSQRRDSISRSTKRSATVVAKPHLPYPVICAYVGHDSVFTKIKEIVAKGVHITNPEYSFVLGAVLANVIYYNSGRNELGEKLLCGAVMGQPKEDGTIYADTGFRHIRDHDNDYYVSHYPAPKNLLHKSTKRRLLQGMFVVDSRIREMINMYNHMKTTVLTKRGETHLLAHLEPFFLSFPGRPVDSAYFIKKFLQMSGLEHMKISCNTVRHATAQLQFDDFMDKLSGGPNAGAAELANRSQSIQDTVYTDDTATRAVKAFQFLRNLCADSSQSEVNQVQQQPTLQFSVISNVSTDDDELLGCIDSDENDNESTTTDTIQPQTKNMNKTRNSNTKSNNRNRITDANGNKRQRSSTGPVNPRKLNRTDAETAEPNFEIRQLQIEHDENTPDDIANQNYLTPELTASDDVHDDSTVTRLLQLHNDNPCAFFQVPSCIEDDTTWNDIERRRTTIPVQDWPHLAVRPVAGCGNGVLAKCDIPRERIVADYRGPLFNELDHERRLEDAQVPESVKNFVRAYRLQINIPSIGTAIMEGHRSVYEGTVVIGRYLNHTSHRECANLAPRYVSRTVDGVLHNVVLFYSTRRIQAGEQLLWDYGKLYADQPWYSQCPSASCPRNSRPSTEPEGTAEGTPAPVYASDSQDPLGSGISMSQCTSVGSAVDRDTVDQFLRRLARAANGLKHQLRMSPCSLREAETLLRVQHNVTVPTFSSTTSLPQIVARLFNIAQSERMTVSLLMVRSTRAKDCSVLVIEGGPAEGATLGWDERAGQLHTLELVPNSLERSLPTSGRLIRVPSRAIPSRLAAIGTSSSIHDIISLF